jgi:lipopolysaccharide/colanic/teichoic acid biosynthesis glycosyltransferase
MVDGLAPEFQTLHRPDVRAGGHGSRPGWYGRIKIGIDFALASTILAASAPTLLVIAALVKLTSRGPVFYKQTRLGRNGRLYYIYKIRSMVRDSERLTGPCWSTPRDPRVTPIGRFLRSTHLDELPQLWNVLRGDMSLVGPRPERPEFLDELEKAYPRYRERLAVRPGLTGLAQVQLPPDSDLTSVRRKLVCDLYYVEHVGPTLDLQILLTTPLYLLGIPFTVSRKLLGTPCRIAIEAATHARAREGRDAHTPVQSTCQPVKAEAFTSASRSFRTGSA